MASQKTPSDDNGGAPTPSKPHQKRQRLSQSDVPAYSLQDALRIAEVLRDEYGKHPTKPIDVASALPMSPNSGPFRMITGAAVAYGITDGGAKAELIALTDLGRRIVAPTDEGEDVRAMREALLRPRVVREFLEKYNGSPLPSERVGLNVLEEMGVPAAAAGRTLDLILRNAEALGMLVEIKGKRYVRLDAPAGAVPTENGQVQDEVVDDSYGTEEAPPVEPPTSAIPKQDTGKVFITHGSNKTIVDQIKEILSFGSFVPVVSVEKESTAKPVSDKVLDDMRGCYAAIVHVGTEKMLIDEHGDQQRMLNPNVLIEIGAAMALYGRRFVLLVEKDVTLPSNLQGLYEVRYEGDRLDYEATMKLLKAFNEFRSED